MEVGSEEDTHTHTHTQREREREREGERKKTRALFCNSFSFSISSFRLFEGSVVREVGEDVKKKRRKEEEKQPSHSQFFSSFSHRKHCSFFLPPALFFQGTLLSVLLLRLISLRLAAALHEHGESRACDRKERNTSARDSREERRTFRARCASGRSKQKIAFFSPRFLRVLCMFLSLAVRRLLHLAQRQRRKAEQEQ